MDRLTAMNPAGQRPLPCRSGSLLSLPGIVQPLTPDLQTLEKMRQTVLHLAEEAIGRLKQSRLEEGKLLTEDLKTNCRFIREKLDIIRERKDEVVQEYHQRLRKRAADLLAQAQLNMARPFWRAKWRSSPNAPTSRRN